jgi:hypothetical protein
MKLASVVTGLCVAALALSACKKKDQGQPADGFQQAQTGSYGPSYGSDAGPTAPPPDAGAPACQPGQPCEPQPGQVPPLGQVGGDPNALQQIIAGALSGTAATLGALTGGEMNTLEAGIKMKAQTDAKGMKPEGQLMSAKLGLDGHAQGSLTLEPGRCYTIIGFATLGVFAYQINLITAPPMPPQVLAQSKADGIDPVVGPNEQCVKNPYPTPLVVNVDMHVIKGQGLVGAQPYKK